MTERKNELIGTWYNASLDKEMLVVSKKVAISNCLLDGMSEDEAEEFWSYNYERDYTIVSVDDVDWGEG